MGSKNRGSKSRKSKRHDIAKSQVFTTKGNTLRKTLRLEKLTKIGGNLQKADDHNTEIVSSTKRWRFVMSKRSIQIPKG